MDNNVDCASDHLRFLNGKAIEEYIREHVFAIHAVKKRICVKYAH